MVAVLIAAMSMGFTSCSKDDNKEPKPDISSEPVIGKWYYFVAGHTDTRYFIEFKANGSYSYVMENETIEGNYKITDSEKTIVFYTWMGWQLYDYITETFLYDVEGTDIYDATLLKMLASGSSVFDQLWVYASSGGSLSVHLYSGSERVSILGGFTKSAF